MREVTASEASRNFAAMLDAAERGESIVVTRGGRRTALICPASSTNGAQARDIIHRWAGNAAFDDVFAERVASARVDPAQERDTDPWRD